MISTQHYSFLYSYMQRFLDKLGIKEDPAKMISEVGFQCDLYKKEWKEKGIPFEEGALVYMLTFFSPYKSAVRHTLNGFVKPSDWVMQNYPQFKEIIYEVVHK